MFGNLLGKRNNKRKNSHRYAWESQNSHKTWRIRNHPININDEYILYSTDTNVGENGIVLYDVKNDKYNITKYPSKISPEYHSYCKYKNDIYMINTDGSIIIYNLNKRTFKTIENIKNQQLIGRYSSCIHIEGTNVIHIFGGLKNQYHLIYSIKDNKYSIKTDFGVKLENPSIIHVKSKKQLIMSCGYAAKTMFIGSIINDDEIQWEISKTLSIPNGLRDSSQMLYKNYIIIFGGCNTAKQYSNNIYLINIDNGEITKLNSTLCPSKDRFHCILINHRIHLFGLWNNVKHHSISIDIIDNNLPQCIQISDTNNSITKPDMDEKKQSIDNVNKDELNNLRNKLQMKDEIIMALKKENNELKLKLMEYEQKSNDNKLDETEYETWDANMICLWICKVENGLFSDYKSKLLSNLMDDGIEGNDLRDINNHEQWKQYGVNKFGHRKILIQNIKMLIDNNQNNKGDEGKASNCTQDINR